MAASSGATFDWAIHDRRNSAPCTQGRDKMGVNEAPTAFPAFPGNNNFRGWSRRKKTRLQGSHKDAWQSNSENNAAGTRLLPADRLLF